MTNEFLNNCMKLDLITEIKIFCCSFYISVSKNYYSVCTF